MTKVELLKQYAAHGMTARQAAEAAGTTLARAYTEAQRRGIAFAKEKRGPKPGTTWAWRNRAAGIDLDRAAQIVAEVEALPPAKLHLYKIMRKAAGFEHAPAMRVVMGVIGTTAVLELYTSEAGTFTIAVTLPDGRTCLLAAGQGWEATADGVPPKGIDG